MFSLKQMLAEMDQALEEKIKTESLTSNAKPKVAFDGKPLAQQSNYYLYTFSLDEPWEEQDETPLTIQIPNQIERVNATLVNAGGMTLTIATDRPLSAEALGRVELFADPTQILKSLRGALKKLHKDPSQLGSKSFGLVPFQIGTQLPHLSFGGFNPDASQARAIQMALGSEVTYIIGPPGTGKTSTLAAIAFAHLVQGRTILIAAHTNIATDNAVMKLCEICQGTGTLAPLENASVLRYGTPQHRGLREDDKYAQIYLPKLAQHYSGHLRQLRQRLETELKDIMTPLMSWLTQHASLIAQQKKLSEEIQLLAVQCSTFEARKHAISLCQQQVGLADLKRSLGELVVRRNGLLQLKDNYETNNQILNLQLQEARTMNAFKRFLKRLDESKLLEDLGEITMQLEKVSSDLEQLSTQQEIIKHNYILAEKKWKELQEDFEAISMQQAVCQEQSMELNTTLTQYNRHIQTNDHQVRQWEQRRKACEEKIAQVEGEVAELEKHLVKNARVIATTLSKVHMSQLLQERRFDVVILDEISMAPLPAVYFAAIHADLSVVAIGDPHQLAPIVSDDDKPIVKTWLGKDLFEQVGITAAALMRDNRLGVFLQKQSRMHPTISRLASQHVYQGLLHDADRVALRHSVYEQVHPMPGCALVLCDTSSDAPMVTIPRGSGGKGRSRLNIHHALCAMAIVQQVLSSPIPLHDSNSQEQRIGIVTPYRAQAQFLQHLIRSAHLEQIVRAGTVHRFQGLEFDVVIFDTVDSINSVPRENFTAGPLGSNAMRLINVAITRARHKLIIIANAPYLQNKLKEHDILALVLKDAQASARLKSQAVLQLPFPSPAEIVRNAFPTSVHEQLLDTLFQESSNLALLKEDTFFEQLERDLRAAKETVVIFSPFIGKTRMATFMRLLLDVHQAGVHITIYTKPPSEYESPYDLLNHLKQTFGDVWERRNMHEKIVILDKEIVYLGSLNVLSHDGKTGEIMLRVKSAPFVKNIKGIMNMSNSAQYTSDETDGHKGPDIALPLLLLPSISSACGICNAQMQITLSKSGPFYGCTQYKRHLDKKFTVDVTANDLSKIQDLVVRSCPECGSPMRIDKAPFQNGILICSKCSYRQEIIFTRN
jgi:phosphatidylserine/phosphatidylglycerophosphate/cardiolipin synthase-like enzyme